jgi:plastocyanin
MLRLPTRVALLSAVLAIALVGLAGCCTRTPAVKVPHNAVVLGASSVAGSRVAIDRDGFTPRSLNIKVGDKVIWTNNDRANHNVGGSGLISGVIRPGESYVHTFDAAGTYQYICTFHPDEEGLVVVEPR